MGLLSLMGLTLGTNFRKFVFFIFSGATVTMLFVMVGRSSRIIMLSQTSTSIISRYVSITTNPKLDVCTSRNASSDQICLRYEVFVVQAGAGVNNMADIGLLKQLLKLSECKLMSSYSLHIVFYKDSVVRAVNETLKLLNKTIQRCTAVGAVVQLDFVEIADRNQAVSTLNQMMVDAYVLRKTNFFSVVFESEFSDGSSQASVQQFLRRIQNFTPQDVGVVFQNGASSIPGRIFFGRKHFEIFGFFIPQSLTDLTKMPEFLQMIYQNDLMITITANGVASGVISKQNPSQIPSVESDLSEYNSTLSRYLQVSAFNPCLRCRNMNSRMVIAMSLYGSDHRYTMGAIRNAQLLPVVFPGWRLWFYVERANPAGVTKYGRVPEDILAKLEDLGAEIVWIDAEAVGLAPMLWRFTVMDSEEVDLFTVRDCDSRLTPRDAAVVSDWLKTDRMFHCIRDHPSHSNFDVSGGLWGARRKPFQQLLGNLRNVMKRYGAGYVEDMNFLGQDVWPKVKDHAYCHDSFSCDRYPSSHPFPVARIGSEHLGEVYDEHSIGREGDINILKSAAVNTNCIPS